MSNLVEGDVLFLNHLERLASSAEAMLRSALEHLQVEVIVGKDPDARSVPLDVAPFTLVAGTERLGAYTGSLHDHFDLVAELSTYQPDEIDLLLRRAATIENVTISPQARHDLAQRSAGTPASVMDLFCRTHLEPNSVS